MVENKMTNFHLSTPPTKKNKYITLPQMFIPQSTPFFVKIVSPRQLS